MNLSPKNIFKIIPSEFSGKLRWCISVALINQVLDFFSIILLVPIIIGVFNPALTITIPHFHFLNQFKDYPVQILGIVVVFFIAKNYISARIIKFQSDYYFKVSNALSVSLLKNFLRKGLVKVKATKKSGLVKDIVFVPNNYVSYVLSPVVQLISDGFLLLFILFGLLLIKPLAASCLLVIIIILLSILYFYDNRQLKNINKTTEEKYNSNFNRILNMVNGYIEIKTNQLEDHFLNEFSHSNQSLNSIYSQLNANRLTKSKHTETILIILISFLFLITRYLTGDVATDVFFVSFLFASALKIIPSVNRILIGITNLKSNLYTIDILTDNIKPLMKNDNEVAEMAFDDEIRLEGISFKFNEAESLLHNINLVIKKGTIVGFYGESGKGKSTLLNIFSTLIKPDSGTIFCDSVKVDHTTENAFLKNIAYVSQSPFILEGTILENLVLNKENHDLEMINEYLSIFDLKESIDALPNKLHTFIGSNGYNLSGGQLQRMAIIRALVKKPKIMLLDEVTNQLDHALKENVLIQLKSITKKQGITIIIISHDKKDLETFCDAIYELKNTELILVS